MIRILGSEDFPKVSSSEDLDVERSMPLINRHITELVVLYEVKRLVHNLYKVLVVERRRKAYIKNHRGLNAPPNRGHCRKTG